jgi:plastocyanin domain-containing protein
MIPADKIIVTILGLGLVVFVLWFFLGRRVKTVQAGREVSIKVDGGYSPESIEVPAGQRTKLIFIRTDPSSCLEEVILSDFKIRKFLPMNQPVEIEIIPKKEGEYRFVCGMNMFHGKLKVV